MRLLNNPKPVAIAILVFLALAMLYRGCQASEGFLELGATYTGELNGGAALLYSERFAGHWDVGLLLVSDQEWEGNRVGNNGGLVARYAFKRPPQFWRWLPSELHLGAAGWIRTDDRLVGCHLGYHLGLRYNIGERYHVGLAHFSNGGVCDANRGQDIAVGFGWRFP